MKKREMKKRAALLKCSNEKIPHNRQWRTVTFTDIDGKTRVLNANEKGIVEGEWLKVNAICIKEKGVLISIPPYPSLYALNVAIRVWVSWEDVILL